MEIYDLPEAVCIFYARIPAVLWNISVIMQTTKRKHGPLPSAVDDPQIGPQPTPPARKVTTTRTDLTRRAQLNHPIGTHNCAYARFGAVIGEFKFPDDRTCLSCQFSLNA